MSPSIVLVLVSLLSIVSTQSFELESGPYDSPLIQRLARRGEILFDRRTPPEPSTTPFVRRDDDASSSTSSSASATSSTTAPSTLPSPFDSSLGTNFTSQSCPDFFSSFLSNTTFQSCVPISLMLQNSNSFFQAERSASLLASTLTAACAAPLPVCQPLMSSLATQLISNDNCGVDYAAQNSIVSQAHAGLLAYEPVYRATCLKSNATGNFCFADAVTSQTGAGGDAYPYYTAVGLNLLPGSNPTCSRCLKETMAIYAGYAADPKQPLAATYPACAKEIDGGCGADFANVTVAVGTMGTSAAAGRSNIVNVAAVAVAAFVVGAASLL